jgi:release factor glutamine methyltransferase
MAFLETCAKKLLTEKYHSVPSDEYEHDLRRLESGEPYEYVLGHFDFLGAHIDLSFRPMIPRPETAFWVARALEELKQKNGSPRLADTFAGSGNVGCALLVGLPHATVDFSEIDPTLKQQIELNIDLNHIDHHRARVCTASALDGLMGTYDAIFAVPPYVPYEALPELDKEMVEYEPHLAFFAHDNGHEFHRILIAKARDYLKEGGTLYMEADMDQNEAIHTLVEGTEWSSLEFWPDPYGATPNVVLRR